jgi:hypothetical protein
MLTWQLLPFDDAVKLHTTQVTPAVTVTELRVNLVIPNQQDPNDADSYYFMNGADGVYKVLVVGNNYEELYLVCNNHTLLLLENVRSSLLRKERIYSLEEYEVLLSINYTAIDNWRLGEYDKCNELYTWLENYITTRNGAITKLTDY